MQAGTSIYPHFKNARTEVEVLKIYYVDPEIIVIALGISIFVGVISGLIPAYQASKMRPVDALRSD